MIRKKAEFISAFLFFIMFWSCGNPAPKNSSGENKSSDLQELAGIPQRIICGSPGISEIVFSLGLGDRVVGVSDFSVFPPEVEKFTRIGGLFNPNRERIVALEPDMIITQGRHSPLADLCREKSIPNLNVKMDDLQDLHNAILHLGSQLNRGEQAQSLTSEIDRQLSAVTERAKSLPRKKIFISLSHTPGDLSGLMTAGGGTFINELITIAGGDNIFSDMKSLYPQVSKESLVMRRPDIIIEFLPEGMSSGNHALLRSDWDRLELLPAVKSGRIHFLSENYLLIPGVRIGMAADKLLETIHPEIKGEPPC